jgi:hypothetical protein
MPGHNHGIPGPPRPSVPRTAAEPPLVVGGGRRLLLEAPTSLTYYAAGGSPRLATTDNLGRVAFWDGDTGALLSQEGSVSAAPVIALRSYHLPNGEARLAKLRATEIGIYDGSSGEVLGAWEAGGRLQAEALEVLHHLPNEEQEPLLLVGLSSKAVEVRWWSYRNLIVLAAPGAPWHFHVRSPLF